MKRILLLALLALAGPLCSQAQHPGGPAHRPMPMDPVLTVLDADTNGVVSAEEIANAAAALLQLDKNGDKQLTQDELLPQADSKTGPGGRRPPFASPVMKALDTNGDGILSQEEISNAPAALKTLDKNNDGQLSRDELMPSRPGGPGGRGRPGFGPGPGGPGADGQ